MTQHPVKWSFSGLKKFKTCPRQYYEVKVAKNYVEKEHESALYGKEFHLAAEEYIRDDKPLDPRFKFAKHMLDTVKAIPGDKYCELEFGLTKDLQPCAFDAPDYWFRGIADVVIISPCGTKARVIDYKTGSAKYADVGQLELMALCIFAKFPQVQKVDGLLLFVVQNDLKKAKYVATESKTYWRNWMPEVQRLERAHETGVWNPNPSGLCKKHCPVTACVHHGSHRS